jgi:excisionase family DNA binding protein
MSDDDLDPLMTRAEVCAYLRITDRTLRSIIAAGAIAVVYAGAQMRISRAALREYLYPKSQEISGNKRKA